MHQTRFILQLLCCLAIIPWKVAKAQNPRIQRCSFNWDKWIQARNIEMGSKFILEWSDGPRMTYARVGSSGDTENVSDALGGAWHYNANPKSGGFTLTHINNGNKIICDSGLSKSDSEGNQGVDNFNVVSAAAAADRSVSWQKNSILSGDFTCQGKREYAILGTKPQQIFVAVFQPPSQRPLEILLYSGVERHASSAVLAVESLDYDIKKLEQGLGWLPDGLQPSKSCVGLNISDGRIDSVHIYWHRKHRRFTGWSL